MRMWLCLFALVSLGAADADLEQRMQADRRVLAIDAFAEAPLRDLLETARQLHATDRLLREYQTQSASNPTAMVVLARLEEALGKRAACIDHLRRAALAPALPARSLARVGKLLENLHHRPEAVAAYDRALAGDVPNKQELALHTAELLLAGHQTKDAEKRLAIARSLSPNDVELRRRIADTLAASGAVKEAVTELEAARALPGLDPTLKSTLTRRVGDLRRQQGDWRGAAEAYQQTWRLLTEASARTDLMAQLVALYRAHGALDELATIAGRGTGAWDHLLAGDAWREHGKKAQAMSEYRLALKADPSLVPARQRLLALTPNGDDRVKLERDLVAARPDNPTFRLELGRTLFDAKKDDEAVRTLTDAAGLFASAPYVLIEIADLLAQHSRFREAASVYERVVAANNDPTARQSLGDCLYKLGDKDKALAAYQAMLGPGSDAAAYQRLIALLRARSYDQPVGKLYLAAIARFGTNDELKRDYATWLGESPRNDLDGALAEWKKLLESTKDKNMRDTANYHVAQLERQKLLQQK